MDKKSRNIRGVVVISIFTILSALGGLIKVGTPVGSIAFDSSSGFFVAAYFSPYLGASVGGLGHLASAATAGFPLTWLHLIVALLQAAWSFIFGIIIRVFDKWWAIIIAGICAVILNGILAPLILAVIQPSLSPLLKSLIPMLFIASLVNVFVASLAIIALSKSRSKRL